MAMQGYVTIHSKVQGAFRGNDKHEFGSQFIAFSFQAESPRDVATGQASGKRQHKPVVISKEWGASTPQLFQALWSNEVLDSVGIEFVRSGSSGQESVYYTIQLTNAVISKVQHIGRSKCSVEFVYEDISFSHSAPRPGSAGILHRGAFTGPVPLPYSN